MSFTNDRSDCFIEVNGGIWSLWFSWVRFVKESRLFSRAIGQDWSQLDLVLNIDFAVSLQIHSFIFPPINWSSCGSYSRLDSRFMFTQKWSNTLYYFPSPYSPMTTMNPSIEEVFSNIKFSRKNYFSRSFKQWTRRTAATDKSKYQGYSWRMSFFDKQNFILFKS